MTDEEISKLAAKLVTKQDIEGVQNGVDRLQDNLGKVRDDIVRIDKTLGKVIEVVGKTREDIKRLEEKTDTILEFVEAVEETTSDHEKRLKVIERVPVVAHQLKSK